MVTVMHPFMSFMNVESSRSYIDNLYSSDADQCLKSIVCIKNSVIGSNRQKECVIAQGIVPRLIQLLEDKEMASSVRLEAAVTIGSLAKGTDHHIELLLTHGTVSILLDILLEDIPSPSSTSSSHNHLIDACLCCLRTLATHHQATPTPPPSPPQQQQQQPEPTTTTTITPNATAAAAAVAVPMEHDGGLGAGVVRARGGKEETGAAVIQYSTEQLRRLLQFAEQGQSVQRQACVAAIVSAACRGVQEQNRLCEVGAASTLAPLLLLHPGRPPTLGGGATAASGGAQEPALRCLGAMCWENAQVAGRVAAAVLGAQTLPQLLAALVTRDQPAQVQLHAATCLTNMHRAGALPATSTVITYRTLPCLVRLSQTPTSTSTSTSSTSTATLASDTLAYLTELDSELQQLAAISNTLITSLAHQLACGDAAARRAAFRAFASLGANDEEIRKRIIESGGGGAAVVGGGVMDRVMEGLVDGQESVRLAAVRCLTSLSRSVQQLRTTFQDHKVWKPLMDLLTTGSPPPELLSAASSALCNLLLEFSPAKEPMIQRGVIELLANLTNRPEPSLRLNGVWALMNLAFQAEQRVKSEILCALGTDQIFRLLADADVRVLMKTLGLLRNLVSPREHTDAMMKAHGPQVMQAVVLVLEGPHAPEVKEQALCILGNIADGAYAKDQIMENEDVLKKVRDYMTHSSIAVQHAAIFCISNLVRREEPGAAERQQRLREMNVLAILQQLLAASGGGGGGSGCGGRSERGGSGGDREDGAGGGGGGGGEHIYDSEAKAAISQFTDL